MIYGILMAALLAAPPTDKPAADPQETGRRYTEWFYAGKTAELWERFTPEMKSALGSVDSLRGFREQVAAQLGAEESVTSERVTPSPPFQVYTRIARFAKVPMPVVVQWSLDAEGRVTGFFIRPRQDEAAPTSHLEYKTKTPLRLPFDGEWTVYWGGRKLEENYHAVTVDQRFAYDLVIVKDGSVHTGDGGTNEQYHCFGQPILAPGPGKVATAVDGIADNRPGPGNMNPEHPPGNHVVIDHGNGEYSLLGHLRQGSVAVKPGDVVKAGDRLGVCGNSGNSSMPHLHYHLQTSPTFGEGEGLPTQFLHYVADGKKVERGEPVRGQAIRPDRP